MSHFAPTVLVASQDHFVTLLKKKQITPLPSAEREEYMFQEFRTRTKAKIYDNKRFQDVTSFNGAVGLQQFVSLYVLWEASRAL